MYNEFNQHKKSDAIKWVIVFILIAVLLVGTAASLVLALSEKNQSEEEQQAYSNDFTAECFNTSNVKLAMSSVATLAADNSVSKTLTATVYPTDASNKLVDWSIAWVNQSKTEEVTNYVTVTPKSEGSLEAIVTCVQPFGSEQIKIIVTTRQGGYTATCIVSFRGLATSIYLTSDVVPVTNAGRGEYYDLPSKNSTSFTVKLSNVWDTVGSYNLSAEISAVGSIYVCDVFGDSFGGSTNENVRLVSISDLLDYMGITATVSGNVVTIKTNKVLDSFFYSHSEPDEYGVGTWYYNDYVYYEDWMEGLGTAYSEEYKTGSAYNASHIDSCYYVLKITDSVSGLSTSVKFWVSTGVSSVKLDETTLSF